MLVVAFEYQFSDAKVYACDPGVWDGRSVDFEEMPRFEGPKNCLERFSENYEEGRLESVTVRNKCDEDVLVRTLNCSACQEQVYEPNEIFEFSHGIYPDLTGSVKEEKEHEIIREWSTSELSGTITFFVTQTPRPDDFDGGCGRFSGCSVTTLPQSTNHSLYTTILLFFSLLGCLGFRKRKFFNS